LNAKSKANAIKQYVHKERKRLNNPPVGLVTAETDRLNGKKTYLFDPHIHPALQWAGKTEGNSFSVDTVSLHVHERIDPLTIIRAVRSKSQADQPTLFGYFDDKENNPPLRDAIEFYKHSQGWSNRLIAGDSLLVMNSLLEKEGLSRKIQMIFLDPPYGIRYGSNFQPFVHERDVKDGKDEHLTQQPEMIKAFRDTWELGIHSYLTYLRDRLLLARELLSETGSIFVQIGDENIHLVRSVMDEVFGANNFVAQISFRKFGIRAGRFIDSNVDYLLWYCKDWNNAKYHQLYLPSQENPRFIGRVGFLELPDGTRRRLTAGERANPKLIPHGARLFEAVRLYRLGGSPSGSFAFEFQGRTFRSPENMHWATGPEGLQRLAQARRLMAFPGDLRYVRFVSDFPYARLTTIWDDTWGEEERRYVVQTTRTIIQRCILMTTDPGDIVLDPTCGSGTTAFVAEQWGRRWITCDTSRVAVTLSKERLMTAVFDYYQLERPEEGISGGFSYNRIPHTTLRSIANNEPPENETLYDMPKVDQTRKRVAGPFTIEAVPSQRVRSGEEIQTPDPADASIPRSGETLRHNEWIDELVSTGIRGKNGQILRFARVEPLPGTRWIHAEAETVDGRKGVISFGPEFAPLEPRQVELAINEAQELVPKPKLVIFVAFQFDPEASKDIDDLKWPGVDLLKVQMNTDLATTDLKKNRASNESFWLVGQPDVEVKRLNDDFQVVVNGFDYYNTRSGELESGDASKIAMWELDVDYDGRSLYPRQVFFPMAGTEGGWNKLAKNLGGLIDQELIENYRGNKSLKFKIGSSRQIAVKIVDDRGIESLKIIRVGE
jgi:adenine-specific DNA-methyltransferase